MRSAYESVVGNATFPTFRSANATMSLKVFIGARTLAAEFTKSTVNVPICDSSGILAKWPTKKEESRLIARWHHAFATLARRAASNHKPYEQS